MLTVTSPTADIMRQITSEDKRASYWFQKQVGGEKKYERLRDELLQQSMATKSTATSDVIDWISQNGNRWMMFECAEWYPKSLSSYTMNVRFCYYETIGSVGAFMVARPQYGIQTDDYVIHFTNHFFLRFCERLEIKMRSRWMVQRFLEILPGVTLFFKGDRSVRDGHPIDVDVRFPGSIGRGQLKGDGNVIEIRTFLTDKQLTKAQRRDTEKMRAYADKQHYEPIDMTERRLLMSDDFPAALMEEIDNLEELGANTREIKMCMDVGMIILEAFLALGYIGTNDRHMWEQHGRNAAEPVSRYVHKYFTTGHVNDADMLNTLTTIARADRIKNFNAQRVLLRIKEFINELNEQITNGN